MDLQEKYNKAIKNFKPEFNNIKHSRAIKAMEEIKRAEKNGIDRYPRFDGLRSLVIKLIK